MILYYILLIALAAVPLLLTISRMRRANSIKKNGVHTNAVVTQIRVLRSSRGGTTDLLTLEYKERATGRSYYGKATVTHQKYKIGDSMSLAYLPDKPAKYAVDTKGAYSILLIFCILLFLFVIFAVYKINEMVKSGSM